MNEPKEQIITSPSGFPLFVVRAWEPTEAEGFWRQDNGLAGWAEFAAWAVVGLEAGDSLLFQSKHDGQAAGVTTDREQGVRVVYGSVKWDGCANFTVDESEDVGFGVVLHACNSDHVRALCEALQAGYEMAAEIVGAERAAL